MWIDLFKKNMKWVYCDDNGRQQTKHKGKDRATGTPQSQDMNSGVSEG